MKRREFSKRVKLEIIIRAWPQPHSEEGFRRICCEKCGAECKRFEIHHLSQDAMQIDKSAKLTAKEGILLCIPCHKEITAEQAPVLAKALRREAAYLGVTKPKGQIKSRGFVRKERAHEGRPPVERRET